MGGSLCKAACRRQPEQGDAVDALRLAGQRAARDAATLSAPLVAAAAAAALEDLLRLADLDERRFTRAKERSLEGIQVWRLDAPPTLRACVDFGWVSSPEQAVAVAMDYAAKARWSSVFARGEVLRSLGSVDSSGSLSVVWESARLPTHGLPPVDAAAGRDFVLARLAKRLGDGRVAGVATSLDAPNNFWGLSAKLPTGIQEGAMHPDLVRAHTYLDGFVAAEKDDGSVSMTYICQLDLRGSLPTSASDDFMLEQVRGLLALKELLQAQCYADAGNPAKPTSPLATPRKDTEDVNTISGQDAFTPNAKVMDLSALDTPEAVTPIATHCEARRATVKIALEAMEALKGQNAIEMSYLDAEEPCVGRLWSEPLLAKDPTPEDARDHADPVRVNYGADATPPPAPAAPAPAEASSAQCGASGDAENAPHPSPPALAKEPDLAPAVAAAEGAPAAAANAIRSPQPWTQPADETMGSIEQITKLPLTLPRGEAPSTTTTPSARTSQALLTRAGVQLPDLSLTSAFPHRQASAVPLASACKWRTGAPMRDRRSNFAGAAILGEKLFVCGGTNGPSQRLESVELLDASTHTWRNAPPMRTHRSALAAGVVGDSLYVCGGWSTRCKLSTVEHLDVYMGVWNSARSMKNDRCGLAMAGLGGALYACGGFDEFRNLSTVERFDPREGAWLPAASMSSKRFSFAVAALHDKLYACGGSDGSGHLGTVECYDPRVDAWSPVAPMAAPRSGLAVAEWGGSLYACGGRSLAGTLKVVERFDPLSNSWSPVSPMAVARAGLAVAVVGGRLYACGGGSPSVEHFGNFS